MCMFINVPLTQLRNAATCCQSTHLTSLSNPNRLMNLALALLLPSRPRPDKTIQSQGNTVNRSHQNLQITQSAMPVIMIDD